MRFRVFVLAWLVLLSAPSCRESRSPSAIKAGSGPDASASPAPGVESGSGPASAGTAELPEGVSQRPFWLGTRPLPLSPAGLGIAENTPRILRDRRLETVDLLPPSAARRFSFSSTGVPGDVLQRSTWRTSCPVTVDELTYLRMSFWGFDDQRHTGEMIVHDDVATDVVTVFRKLYSAHFPIEEMRVTARRELDAAPTGDGNNTAAFVCRKASLSSEWSEHAYGRAVDINPFHNPYVRGGVTIPELAIAYRTRDRKRPGMIEDADVVTKAFGDIGWGWGGEWQSVKDWMHFSLGGG